MSSLSSSHLRKNNLYNIILNNNNSNTKIIPKFIMNLIKHQGLNQAFYLIYGLYAHTPLGTRPLLHLELIKSIRVRILLRENDNQIMIKD